MNDVPENATPQPVQNEAQPEQPQTPSENSVPNNGGKPIDAEAIQHIAEELQQINPQGICICICHIQGGNADKILHITTCVHCAEQAQPLEGEVLPINHEQKAVDNRQPNGKFGPGNIANPNGRPRREWTWATLIEDYADKKKQIKNKETGVVSEYTYRELVVKRLFTEAANGNMKAITEVIDRMDGKPVQETLISSDKNYEISVKRG